MTMNAPTKAEGERLAEWMTEAFGVTCDGAHAGRDKETGTAKSVQKWNGGECWEVMSNWPMILSRQIPMMAPSYQLHLDCYWKFVRLVALWMIDGLPQSQWGALGDAIDQAADKWLEAFLLVGHPADVTPTMHSVIAHYGDHVREHGSLMPYCCEGMEHKHKPIKRTGREHTNMRDWDSEYVSPFSSSIMQCARRLLATQYIVTHVPGASKRMKRDTFNSNADKLTAGRQTGESVTATEVRTTYAGRPVKVKRDRLLETVAELQKEFLLTLEEQL
eukprot:jgi/Tetstr1/464564/TSEL_009320.t1